MVFVLRQGGLLDAHDEEVQSMDVPARDVLSLHSCRPLGRVSVQNLLYSIHVTDISCCSDKHHIISFMHRYFIAVEDEKITPLSSEYK